MAAGFDGGLAGFSTGYLGLGGDHTRYEFSNLGITGFEIIGAVLSSFDDCADDGFSGLISGGGVTLVGGNTVTFRLDDLLFKKTACKDRLQLRRVPHRPADPGHPRPAQCRAGTPLQARTVSHSAFLNDLAAVAEWVEPKGDLTTPACRDPDDEKFLQLALAAQAGWLVTGDQDLLMLKCVGVARIVNPAAALLGTGSGAGWD